MILRQNISGFAACLLLIWGLAGWTPLKAGQLYVGGATASITPDEPVALAGQRAIRISQGVDTPCTATALAVETRENGRSTEQAIFVSCDLVAIRGGDDFYGSLRDRIRGRVPDEVLNKLIVNATHTHTGPVATDGTYDLPESGVMSPSRYREFLMERLGNIIVEAWERREPARVAWGLGHAVIGQNRRSVYANGTAQMYGKANAPHFRGLEGNDDHGVEILYFWNAKDELIGTAINVACPAQEVESLRRVNADFWHPVRERLRQQHGEQLMVLGWIGAGGDQSPHLMFRQAGEERMRTLRGLDRLGELARRLVTTWEDVLEVVRQDRHDEVTFKHAMKVIKLPYRKITEAEVQDARRQLAQFQDPNDPRAGWSRGWHGRVVDRYERQQQEPQFYEMELHAVRLGDIAIVTNDFELFTDFGVQIKARSPAVQTFVIQLCGPGTYVPTERAMAGGGYSAIPQSNVVGAEGGQVLVNETVDQLDLLWPKSPPASRTSSRSP